jgi:hypothetical protein
MHWTSDRAKQRPLLRSQGRIPISFFSSRKFILRCFSSSFTGYRIPTDCQETGDHDLNWRRVSWQEFAVPAAGQKTAFTLFRSFLALHSLLRRSAIFHADRRNNSSFCLFRRLSRPQDSGTPSNSTRHTCQVVIWAVTHPSTNRDQRCLTLVIK